LRLYAEPEARAPQEWPGAYRFALIVPALGESASLLDGYRAAARKAPGRVLIVLVVNATAATEPALLAENQRLFQELVAEQDFTSRLISDRDFDILVVNRSLPGRYLPERQGVGLARKIGMDLALSLHEARRVETPWLFATDADARLPSDYFCRDFAAELSTASAGIYDYEHVATEDPAVNAATREYEASLRYHVLGLAHAGSPYAFHALGSTLCVAADAYAAVRGVPKRQAGEDFYLLDKLSKVRSLVRLRGEPIVLASRRSARVPFGTGPSVERLLLGEELLVTAPACYEALRSVLQGIHDFARLPVASAWVNVCSRLAAELGEATRLAVERCGLIEAAGAAVSQVSSAGLARRLHTWFDALKTLQFLHLVRDAGFPEVPLRQGLQRAQFAGGGGDLPFEQRARLLTELEWALPRRLGPAS
jgi:hypothetical protein